MKHLPYALHIFGLGAALMAQDTPPRTAEDRVVAVEKYESPAMRTTLTLYHRALPQGSKAAQLRYILNTKPAAGASNNLMFYLVTGEPGSSNRKVVWLTYGASPDNVRPQAIFSAGVHAMPARNSAYVAVAKALDAAVDFTAYRVDPSKAVADFPLILDPELREGWPPPSQPESTTSYKPAEHSFCVVGSLEMSAVQTGDQPGFTIRAIRQPLNMCGPLRITFHPDSRRWSEVSVLPVPPAQK